MPMDVKCDAMTINLLSMKKGGVVDTFPQEQIPQIQFGDVPSVCRRAKIPMTNSDAREGKGGFRFQLSTWYTNY